MTQITVAARPQTHRRPPWYSPLLKTREESVCGLPVRLSGHTAHGTLAHGEETVTVERYKLRYITSYLFALAARSDPPSSAGAASTPPPAATCNPTTSVRAAAHAATPFASLRLCSASSALASCVRSASILPHRTPRACEQVRSIWLELALCSGPREANGTAGSAAESPWMGSSDIENDPGPP